jgi:hypothetical protein
MSDFMRDSLVTILVVAIFVLAVSFMLRGEAVIDMHRLQVQDPNSYRIMIDGLMRYFQGMGAALIASAVGWMYFTAKPTTTDDVSTRFETKDGKVPKRVI